MVKVARELECVVLEEPRKAFDLFVRAEKQCCALTKDVVEQYDDRMLGQESVVPSYMKAQSCDSSLS